LQTYQLSLCASCSPLEQVIPACCLRPNGSLGEKGVVRFIMSPSTLSWLTADETC
jgi:hypothetical protein